MAGAWVQTVDKQTASGTSLAIAITTTAANHLSILTSCGSNVACAAPTVSNGGAVQNAIADFGDGSGAGAGHLREDYQENIAGGATTVTVKSASATEITGIVRESSGVATGASLGAVSHATSATAVASLQTGSITPAAGSILYAGTEDAGSSTSADTIDSSFTVDSDSTAWNGANQRAGSAHLNNAAAAAVNPKWTLPASQAGVGAYVVEYKQAAGSTSWSRTISSSIACSVAVSRQAGYGRTISVGVASAIAVSRMVTYARTISVLIANSVSVSRVYGAVRSISTSIASAVAVSRLVSYGRTISSSIGIQVAAGYAGQQVATVFNRMMTGLGF